MARSSTAIETHAPKAHADVDEIPALVSHLGTEIAELFDAKARLLKLELKEELVTYVVGTASILVAAMVALIGLIFASLAAVFGLSTLFLANGFTVSGGYALSFVIIGG